MVKHIFLRIGADGSEIKESYEGLSAFSARTILDDFRQDGWKLVIDEYIPDVKVRLTVMSKA